MDPTEYEMKDALSDAEGDDNEGFVSHLPPTFDHNEGKLKAPEREDMMEKDDSENFVDKLPDTKDVYEEPEQFDGLPVAKYGDEEDHERSKHIEPAAAKSSGKKEKENDESEESDDEEEEENDDDEREDDNEKEGNDEGKTVEFHMDSSVQHPEEEKYHLTREHNKALSPKGTVLEGYFINVLKKWR